ncbi:ATP-binding protein [Streptomyces sp. TRM72054]|uniref:ATP-binding protein n=1 Tax=Streptomyces sp. TRM72054 TaxID=2870562 RepID=UPI001C8BF08A|nr:ATP-binding protein [Streptomyces sp. TRM72054]MBX9392076.1 ATP-binding protein [Streptomyces sp. TRM72054]
MKGRDAVPGNWQRIEPDGSAGVRRGTEDGSGWDDLSGRFPGPRSGDFEQEGGTDDRAPAFVPEQPLRSLDEVILPDTVRQRVELALDLVEHHTLLYDTWNLRSIDPYRRGTALNLYGPSGTGKSLCAEALAHRLGRPVINVDYAQIESKYPGDTPKNIVRCFGEAREHGAVLVFDEADSILGSRLSRVSHSADHAVNVSRAVMLRQLDRFDGVVVFTTNFERNYDVAFVRRILAHVRFELPDAQTLHRLWERLLPAALPVEPGVDKRTLAEKSVGLAGGDLVNVITGAAAAAARRNGRDGVVTVADLTAEIENAHRARAEVGRSPGGDPHASSGEYTVRRLDPQEVPPDQRSGDGAES